ncbi:MAG: hypothetical protein FJZ01_08190 [Candidatus Sericytochromatia bacterium]|nr:hypothetical protein [Candidatus Tanganyikabacteria bacterium]
MTSGPLPEVIKSTRLDERERQAAIPFRERVRDRLPGVAIEPRRTQAGHLKMVVTYPEACDMEKAVDALAETVLAVRSETGEMLILD